MNKMMFAAAIAAFAPMIAPLAAQAQAWPQARGGYEQFQGPSSQAPHEIFSNTPQAPAYGAGEAG